MSKKPKLEPYPLPPDLLLPNPSPPLEHSRAPAWPARSLLFQGWHLDVENERDTMIRDILIERGWTNGFAPCPTYDTNLLLSVIENKCKEQARPRRCLWIVGDDKEARLMIKSLGASIGPTAHNFYRLSSFGGSEPACYKTTTAKLLSGKSYVPQTFIMPAQEEQLRRVIKANPKTCWIGKPKNSYAGRGLFVAPAAAALKTLVGEGADVIQSYISNPLLLGGYKSHLRVYLLATSLDKKSPRAYVHKEACVMFSTEKFTLEKSSMGPNNFKKRVHLTNFDINACADNPNYVRDKDVIGSGSLWSSERFEEHLREHTDIDGESMWRQIRLIGRDVTLGLIDHRSIKECSGGVIETNLCHEVYGLDVMLDDGGKVWLLECNNSPGLEYCGSHFPDGTIDPDAEENDLVTLHVIEDRFALLGMDREVCSDGNADNYLRVL